MRKLTNAEMKWLKMVIPNFLVYSKKEKKAYCVGCNNEFDAELKIGSKVKCPHCGRISSIRNKGRRKIYNLDRATGIIPCKDDNGNLVLRYYNISRHYGDEYRNTFLSVSEILRETYYPNGEFITEELRDGEFKKCKLKNNDYYVNWYTNKICGIKYSLDQKTFLYSRNLKKYLSNTKVKYIDFNKITNGYQMKHWWDFHYLLLGTLTVENENLLYEYLVKCNLIGIARETINESFGITINLEAKSLIDILGLRKDDFHKLLKLKENATKKDLYKYHMMNKYEIKSEEEWNIYAKYIDKKSYRSDELIKYFPFSLYKYEKYALQQESEVGHPIDIAYYVDYLKMCSELNLDMKNTFVSMPKDLYKSHDMVADLYNEMTFELKLMSYAEDAKKFENNYSNVIPFANRFLYENDEIKILVPKSTREIGEEGFKLRHCVAQYMQDIVNNKKTILFIRDKKELDVPFFTMEIVGNEITQCKGYRNCPRPENVERFLNQFAKAKGLTITKNEYFAAIG